MEVKKLEQIDLSDANGNILGFDWAPPAFKRSGVVRVGGVVTSLKGFTPVPRTLVDGTLPPPAVFGVHGNWICQQDWDFLVYAYSNGRGRSFAQQDAMRERVGIGSYDYYLIGEEQVRAIREGMWERLVNAGLAATTTETRYGVPLYDLLIPPQVAPNGLRPTRIRATVANMEAEGEHYVRVPRAVFTDQVWKQIRTHELRRVLAAAYCFNDLVRFGGVDPEELRLEDGRMSISDAFQRACGQDDAVRVACCLDYLSSRCGLMNWAPVEIRRASIRPGAARLVYVRDDPDSAVMVMRPTLQILDEWEDWSARQGESSE